MSGISKIAKHRALIVGIGIAVFAAAGYFLLRPSGQTASPDGGPQEAVRAVYCAAFSSSPGGNQVATGPKDLSLEVDIAGTHATAVFVADARGASEDALARLEILRAELEASPPDVVVVLGGVATQKSELTQLLRLLASTQWTTVAMPGGRERVVEFHEVVAALAAQGLRVVDGTEQRFIVLGQFAVIATLPGVGHPAKVIPAGAGCLYRPQDLKALATRARSYKSPLVLASYSPPRQVGEGGSDRTVGGIHIGDPLITEFVDDSRPLAVVHGVNDDVARQPATGTVSVSQSATTAIIATGAMESLRRFDSRASGAYYVEVKIDRDKLAWKRSPLARK